MKKGYYIVPIVLIILFMLIYFKPLNSNKEVYSFAGKSFSYSQDRGKLDYSLSLKEVNNSIDIFSVNYQSRPLLNYSTRIFGLIFIPSNKTQVPGLVYLPGGGVKKEDKISLAQTIAKLGYAVIVIDQRGIGETAGYYLSPEQDYELFSQGKEAMQHLAVFDVLRAYDLLKEMPQIDKNNIAVAGESMGGRYAIIAAAIDKRLKGVIGISTSGFHFDEYNSLPYTPYLVSTDPDHYISFISPNLVFMLHSEIDNMIPINDSLKTFALAKEPKRFFPIKTGGHGYSSDMLPQLERDLKELFGK